MADSQRKTALLNDNPLCGIDTYKDELNLATGECTRKIKKLVFNGTEWWYNNSNNACCVLEINQTGIFTVSNPLILCSHVQTATSQSDLFDRNVNYGVTFGASRADRICIRNKDCEPVDDFKAWLAAEYANGTPVTVWYVLETPTTETITVPSGLSGMEEGYLNQSGTPIPTNPIYPTANTVEKWFDTNHYIMGTSTDTITTLPADVYADGNNATVGLVGNMSQTGTPSPTTPIQPSETGDRTGNLWDKQLERGTLNENASPIGSTYQQCKGDTASQRVRSINAIHTNGVATISFNDTKYNLFVLFFDNDALYTGRCEGWKTGTFTVNSPYIGIVVKPISGNISPDADDFNIMINSGETALPYEPYGYKIPILNNSQTTNVYLGEVQSTRRIKKLVLTGTETWYKDSSDANRTVCYMNLIDCAGNTGYCTHIEWKSSYAPTEYNKVVYQSGTYKLLYISIANTYISDQTAEAFKEWLASEYSAGTPVTIWYIRATPETAVVNEPLRKIGTYADEVSGITIPTITGADSFDVLTTLKPSEVELTYTGWHDATVKEWDGSEWQ